MRNILMRLHQHIRAVGGVLQRVADDIGEQLAQTILVPFDHDVVGNVHFDDMRMPTVGDLQRFDGVVKKLGEVEPFDIQAGGSGLHAAQIQQERDQIA